MAASHSGFAVTGFSLASIKGQPTGTGNVTVSLYQNGVLIDQSVITSPYYVNPSSLLNGGTNLTTNTLTAVDLVNVSQWEGITFLGSQNIFARISRGTTLTGGFVSVIQDDASAISR